MIKLILSLAFAFVAISPRLEAVSPTVAEFTNGQKTKFSTDKHAKAKGLNMTISYPNSWVAKEGNRPNILQKFVSNGGTGTELFMIITKSLPGGATLSNEEAKALFTEESLKEFLPEGSNFISGRPTKIEGLPAGIVEFSNRTERAGMIIEQHIISYIFCSGSTMVQIQCAVTSLPGGKITAKEQMEEMRPLFTLIANSVVLPDQWK
ncbi:MAG: hypothetical protein WCP45_16655 [Verrucomicrobiota bacterium]